MKGADKFLIGIVAGIVLLVIIAFAVTLTRPEPSYQADDTAEGVAHNYLLALQKLDYGRAYGYLSPSLKGYPTSEAAFAEDVRNFRWDFRLDDSTTLAVESVNINGEQAVAMVQESRFYGGGLFDANSSVEHFRMELEKEEAGWKIVNSDAYFAWTWREPRE